MVKYIQQQWRLGQKKGILEKHLPDAMLLFQKLKLREDKDYDRILGTQKEKLIGRYFEEHYLKGALLAFELTQSLKISLLYLYHGIEGAKIDAITLPQEIKKLEQPVKDMLLNYYEIKALDSTLYTAQEVSKYYPCALVHKDQYITRFIDELSKLSLSAEMPIDANRKLLAKKIFAHSHVVNLLRFHELGNVGFNAAFSVVAPRIYESIETVLYGENKEKGKERLMQVAEGMEKTLVKFLRKNDIEGYVNSRIKTVYSIYKKITEKYKLPIREGLKIIHKIPDLIAARIILTGKSNNMEGVYRVLDKLNEVGFKLAEKGDIFNNQNPVRNYYRFPPTDPPRPYHAIHVNIKIDPLKVGEIKIQREKDHLPAEFGSGEAGRGRYKGRNLPSVAQEITRAIENIHSIIKINKPVKIAIAELSGVEEIPRFDQAAYEMLNDKNHLASKIMRHLRKIYPGAKIEDPVIDELLMDKIATSERSNIKVYVTRDETANTVTIGNILKVA